MDRNLLSLFARLFFDFLLKKMSEPSQFIHFSTNFRSLQVIEASIFNFLRYFFYRSGPYCWYSMMRILMTICHLIFSFLF